MTQRVRCPDLPGPDGDYVACGDRLVPFDERAARSMAQDGMLLALDPEHAQQLIEQSARQDETPAAAATQ